MTDKTTPEPVADALPELLMHVCPGCGMEYADSKLHDANLAAHKLRAALAQHAERPTPADSLQVDAAWQAFCRTADYRRSLEWANGDEVPGALFVAFRHGLSAVKAAQPAERQGEAVGELVRGESDDWYFTCGDHFPALYAAPKGRHTLYLSPPPAQPRLTDEELADCGLLSELAQPPREPVQPLSDTVSVCKTDANNYCRILTALGMEEEGDPVAEVERLITERMSAGGKT